MRTTWVEIGSARQAAGRRQDRPADVSAPRSPLPGLGAPEGAQGTSVIFSPALIKSGSDRRRMSTQVPVKSLYREIFNLPIHRLFRGVDHSLNFCTDITKLVIYTVLQ